MKLRSFRAVAYLSARLGMAAWLIAGSAGAQVPVSAADARSRDFDAYVAQAVRDWNVAGLAIAVVKDGRLLFAKGYGVRELGKPAPVDTQTLFAIASTTKAMTAAAIAMLVDDGKLKWDDPVTKHLPAFQLYDPYATRELTVRDLLTHRAGLGNADYLWDVGDNTAAEIVSRTRHIKPAYSLRSGFVYQNVMYLVAGEVVAAASGMPWSRFVQTRIFAPLGMTRTVPSLAMIPTGANAAAPHYRFGDTVRVIANSESQAIGPAGGVWSNVSDMSKWMVFILDSSRAGGKRLLKPDTFAELLKPQVVVPLDEFYPTAAITRPHWMTYGLGWFQHDYAGRMLNFHTGSLAGMVAIIGLVPDARLGVYVLANVDHAEVRHALMYRALDTYLGNPPRDWSYELRVLYDRRRTSADSAKARAEAKRVKGTRPSLSLAKYAGTYSDQLFGRIEVIERGGKLRIDAGRAYKGDLEHWQYDTFRAKYDQRWQGTDTISFMIGDGVAKSLSVGDHVLTRIASDSAAARSN